MKALAKEWKKVTFSFLIIFVLAFVSCPNVQSSEAKLYPIKTTYTSQELETISSINFAHILQTGWNLGNSLDSIIKDNTSKQGLEIETLRGNPYTTKEMIRQVKSIGFTTIRIPISWHDHVTKNGAEYTIDPEWMNRVKEIVDWSLEENLFVIINSHHDDRYNDRPGVYVSKNSNLQQSSMDFLTSIWTQIAETFKNYDNHLIFEVMNEPRYMEASSGNSFRPNNTEQYLYNPVITMYEECAIEAIRNVGNNNANRFIIVMPYGASPWTSNYWNIPSDTAKDKLIISVHTYSPYDFAMGTKSTTRFTDKYRSDIKNLMNVLLPKQYTSKGYGVIIGETSASDKGNRQDRIEWSKTFYSMASSSGISVILWDNNNPFTVEKINYTDYKEFHGYMNRKALSGTAESIPQSTAWYDEEYIRIMINAYKGN